MTLSIICYVGNYDDCHDEPSIVGSVLMYAKVNKAKIEKGLHTPTFIFTLVTSLLG